MQPRFEFHSKKTPTETWVDTEHYGRSAEMYAAWILSWRQHELLTPLQSASYRTEEGDILETHTTLAALALAAASHAILEDHTEIKNTDNYINNLTRLHKTATRGIDYLEALESLLLHLSSRAIIVEALTEDLL